MTVPSAPALAPSAGTAAAAVADDSVIATHHWSFASLKATDCAETVELLELLYQVPPLYHLNLSELQE